jgi:hypothetical protein
MGDTPNTIVGGGAGIATEPLPVKNGRPYIQDLVVADLNEPQMLEAPGSARVKADISKRKEFGIKKYGTGLQAFNGRRPLVDAYQEVLDGVMYLRQAFEEEKEKGNLVLADTIWFEYDALLTGARTLAEFLPAEI